MQELAQETPYEWKLGYFYIIFGLCKFQKTYVGENS